MYSAWFFVCPTNALIKFDYNNMVHKNFDIDRIIKIKLYMITNTYVCMFKIMGFVIRNEIK